MCESEILFFRRKKSILFLRKNKISLSHTHTEKYVILMVNTLYFYIEISFFEIYNRRYQIIYLRIDAYHTHFCGDWIDLEINVDGYCYVILYVDIFKRPMIIILKKKCVNISVHSLRNYNIN